MPELSELARKFSEWLTLPAAVTGLAVPFLLHLMVSWRVRSAHPLLAQLWRLVGRTDGGDGTVARLVKLREELLTFRFFFGLQARTLTQVRRLNDWAEKHDEDMSDIAACGPLYDIELCDLRRDKIPGKRAQGGKILLLVALLYITLIPAFLTMRQDALASFKESGTWVWLSNESATIVRSGAKIDRATCDGSKPSASELNVTSSERTALCKAFGTPDATAFIKEGVRTQRVSFCIFAAMALAYFVGVFRWLLQGDAARKMQARLDPAKNKPPVSIGKQHEPPSVVSDPGVATSSSELLANIELAHDRDLLHARSARE